MERGLPPPVSVRNCLSVSRMVLIGSSPGNGANLINAITPILRGWSRLPAIPRQLRLRGLASFFLADIE